jgi:hypothetical protein
MPNLCFTREGLTMVAGIFRDKAKKDKVADFTLAPNDAVAQMIIDAWCDDGFKQVLLNPDNAKALFAARGLFWNGTTLTPVVISEDDYNNGYTKKDKNHLVFVLPNHNGQCPPGQTLLDTARLLMACTPNGI